VGFCITKQRVI
jgi:hypothetical protein